MTISVQRASLAAVLAATQAVGLLIAQQKPAPAPERWEPFIGQYGPQSGTLYIYEKNGKLTALVDHRYEYPMDELGPGRFRFPPGRYGGGVAEFSSLGMRTGNLFFARRPDPAGPGATFRITPLKSTAELREIARASKPPKETGEFRKPDLVELVTLDPTIHLDIRYASTNNFVGTAFYTQARAFLQRPAAEALVRAHQWLKTQGYGLLIHDAYRPWSVTKMFWEATPVDKREFVADPAEGSKHNRGCAVDLTLYQLDTGRPVRMTGVYDEMSERSYPDYPGGTSLERWHRDLLRRAMEREGFTVFEFEWWHFDYRDWPKYAILNVPFDQLR